MQEISIQHRQSGEDLRSSVYDCAQVNQGYAHEMVQSSNRFLAFYITTRDKRSMGLLYIRKSANLDHGGTSETH
jgi:hypothetical protein